MTDGDVRQGIHFDMDTKALEIYYPKAAWRAAYEDVKTFLIDNGFEHEQGSGYHSIRPMAQAKAVDILDNMLTTYPWLHKCVRICTVADVPATYDFSDIFDKDADVPARDADVKAHDTDDKQSVIDQIRAHREKPQEHLPSPHKKSKGKNGQEL